MFYCCYAAERQCTQENNRDAEIVMIYVRLWGEKMVVDETMVLI
jgi:hypothetical protein